jgi:hypothetical protein
MWIQNAITIERPPFKLEFDSVELSLRDGVIPRLGILVRGLTMSAKDPCITSAGLHIDQLFIPVSLHEGLIGRLYVRRMQAHHVELVLGEKTCSTLESTSEIHVLPALDKFFRTRFAQELQNTRQRLAGVDIESFSIRTSAEPNPLMVFSRLLIETGRDGGLAQATARVDIDKDFLGTPVAPYIWLKLTTDGQVIDGTGRVLFREGLVEAKAHLRALTAAVDWQTNIQHLPLKPFYDRLRTSQHWSPAVNLEGTWGFCKLESGTNLTNLLTAPILSSSCYVEGDVGKVTIDDTRMWVSPVWKYDRFHMGISHLALPRLFSSPLSLGFRNIDVKPNGYFQGTLDISPEQVSAQGIAEGIEIGVWRNRVRARQILDRVQGRLQMKAQSTEVHVTGVNSGGADWKGTADLIMRTEGLESTFKVNMTKVELDSSIVHLFVPADIEAINVQLSGSVLESVAEIHGSVDIPQIDGPLFSAEQVHVAVDTDPDEPYHGGARAEGVVIYAKPIVQAFHPLVAGTETLDLTNLSGQWRNDQGKIGWSELSLTDKKSKNRISSLGEIDIDGQLTGLALRRAQASVTPDRFELGGLWPQEVHISELTNPKGKERQLKKLNQQILER